MIVLDQQRVRVLGRREGAGPLTSVVDPSVPSKTRWAAAMQQSPSSIVLSWDRIAAGYVVARSPTASETPSGSRILRRSAAACNGVRPATPRLCRACGHSVARYSSPAGRIVLSSEPHWCFKVSHPSTQIPSGNARCAEEPQPVRRCVVVLHGEVDDAAPALKCRWSTARWRQKRHTARVSSRDRAWTKAAANVSPSSRTTDLRRRQHQITHTHAA